jgi:hypothetical protein
MGNGFRDSGNRELYTFEAFYGTNSEDCGVSCFLMLMVSIQGYSCESLWFPTRHLSQLCNRGCGVEQLTTFTTTEIRL